MAPQIPKVLSTLKWNGSQLCASGRPLLLTSKLLFLWNRFWWITCIRREYVNKQNICDLVENSGDSVVMRLRPILWLSLQKQHVYFQIGKLPDTSVFMAKVIRQANSNNQSKLQIQETICSTARRLWMICWVEVSENVAPLLISLFNVWLAYHARMTLSAALVRYMTEKVKIMLSDSVLLSQTQ